jgi:3-oxoacyl-[acyl-carrier protein] reductase
MPPSTRSATGRLTGKVAVITGAGSGIGRTTARRFAEEGALVVAADLNLAQAQETLDGLEEAGLAVQTDVRDPAAIEAMIDAAVARFGTVDVFHSNAGIAEAVKPVGEIDIEEWEAVIGVNLTAFFLCARAVAPVMRAHGGGSIIVTGSIAARRPRPGMAAYVASKSGAIGLARALAIEFAPDAIRVNAINPGPARTPMLKEFAFHDDEAETLRSLGDALPLGAIIEPDDIASAAIYLASDEAAKITGLVLNVDGGRDL